MQFIRYILFLMPLLVFSQQTVEICGNTKTYTYKTISDLDGTIEWYVLGSYYYGNEITLTWDKAGIFTISAVALTDDCSSMPQTYTVTVKECDPLVVWVPNAFTPNDDEFNTTWGAVVSGPVDLYDFRLIVFNRWGELIWESYDVMQWWDGQYNGIKVQDGTYTWHIDLGVLKSDARYTYMGHVNILR